MVVVCRAWMKASKNFVVPGQYSLEVVDDVG